MFRIPPYIGMGAPVIVDAALYDVGWGQKLLLHCTGTGPPTGMLWCVKITNCEAALLQVWYFLAVVVVSETNT